MFGALGEVEECLAESPSLALSPYCRVFTRVSNSLTSVRSVKSLRIVPFMLCTFFDGRSSRAAVAELYPLSIQLERHERIHRRLVFCLTNTALCWQKYNLQPCLASTPSPKRFAKFVFILAKRERQALPYGLSKSS